MSRRPYPQRIKPDARSATRGGQSRQCCCSLKIFFFFISLVWDATCCIKFAAFIRKTLAIQMRNLRLQVSVSMRLNLDWRFYRLQQNTQNAISFQLSNRKTARALQVSDVNLSSRGNPVNLSGEGTREDCFDVAQHGLSANISRSRFKQR